MGGGGGGPHTGGFMALQDVVMSHVAGLEVIYQYIEGIVSGVCVELHRVGFLGYHARYGVRLLGSIAQGE